MADEEKEGAAQPAVPRKRGIGGLFENKVVLLGVIVIAQALTALAVTRFFIAPRLAAGPPAAAAAAGGHGAPHGGEAVGHDREGEIVGLEEMIITLSGEAAAPHYLRTNVSLEVADPKVALLIEERRAQLRDIVIMSLSERTAADLLAPDGKEEARREIAERIGAKLPPNSLINVYFSDLMIQ